jgi:XTP/dITP diphosphohydrolase
LKLLFATRNPGKLAELSALVGDRLAIVSLSDVDVPEVVEDGETFEDNARKKALAAAGASGLPALADDSGLCVDALGGAPGVRSARYAEGDDRARYQKLLQAMRDVPDEQRAAAFQCALCLAFPDGSSFTCSGECRGFITRAPRGANGFGYDPVFELDDSSGRTMAELSREEKGRFSHRGRAFRAVVPRLEALARGVMG